MKTGGWTTIGPGGLVTCKRCGCVGLAWAKSRKTGRSYLCHVRRVNTDYRESYWIMPNVPHSCEEYKARQDKAQAEREAVAQAREAHRAGELADLERLREMFKTAPDNAREYIKICITSLEYNLGLRK